jgi:hypothetical protein
MVTPTSWSLDGLAGLSGARAIRRQGFSKAGLSEGRAFRRYGGSVRAGRPALPAVHARSLLRPIAQKRPTANKICFADGGGRH